MPIEIRELVVRATVSENKEGNATGNNASGSGPSKDQMAQKVVDQIKEMMRKKKER